MRLTITTLVIIHHNDLEGIYHSLEQDIIRAHEELVQMVNAEYEDEEEGLHFHTIQDIKNYFDEVSIQTQELTSTGFNTAVITKNQSLIPVRLYSHQPNHLSLPQQEKEEYIKENLGLLDKRNYIRSKAPTPNLQRLNLPIKPPKQK